jgi:hypothetical protein
MSTIIKATSTRKDMCNLTLEVHLVDKAHLSLHNSSGLSIHPSFQPQYSTNLFCEVNVYPFSSCSDEASGDGIL